MLAGVRSGRLAEVLEEYVDLQHSQSELRRRVWMALAYPFILLLFDDRACGVRQRLHRG